MLHIDHCRYVFIVSQCVNHANDESLTNKKIMKQKCGMMKNSPVFHYFLLPKLNPVFHLFGLPVVLAKLAADENSIFKV